MTKGQFEIIKLILKRTSEEHEDYLKRNSDLPELIEASLKSEIEACKSMMEFIEHISN